MLYKQKIKFKSKYRGKKFCGRKKGRKFLIYSEITTILAFSTLRWIEREGEREKERTSIEIHKARVVNRVCAEEHTAEACSCLTKTIIPAFLNRQDGIISVEEATAAIDARVESDKRG